MHDAAAELMDGDVLVRRRQSRLGLELGVPRPEGDVILPHELAHPLHGAGPVDREELPLRLGELRHGLTHPEEALRG
eukprot:1421832-Pyramimonas_sp.AAC.1